jgi:uncharacterized protein YcsI (UPF0317 family)
MEDEFVKWTDKMIANTEYWVEANTYERWRLYDEFGAETVWKQEPMGCTYILGYVMDNMPVNISITWIYINDRLVAFYHGCSMVVDNRLIDRFLHNKPKTDAMNFHICIDDLFKEEEI